MEAAIIPGEGRGKTMALTGNADPMPTKNPQTASVMGGL